ncbi:hypothetical protein [Marinactinospora rubrisoli]|uniref:Uncharacterized protein n=1 Tax=Marinactinospora rubrisoli TaxID=2715399 RepID=A0ABW2KDX1_9ACTN
MEIAELVLEYVRVLVWPVVVLVLAFLLRDRLRELLTRLTSAEALGARAEFAVSAALADEAIEGLARAEADETDLWDLIDAVSGDDAGAAGTGTATALGGPKPEPVRRRRTPPPPVPVPPPPFVAAPPSREAPGADGGGDGPAAAPPDGEPVGAGPVPPPPRPVPEARWTRSRVTAALNVLDKTDAELRRIAATGTDDPTRRILAACGVLEGGAALITDALVGSRFAFASAETEPLTETAKLLALLPGPSAAHRGALSEFRRQLARQAATALTGSFTPSVSDAASFVRRLRQLLGYVRSEIPSFGSPGSDVGRSPGSSAAPPAAPGGGAVPPGAEGPRAGDTRPSVARPRLRRRRGGSRLRR